MAATIEYYGDMINAFGRLRVQGLVSAMGGLSVVGEVTSRGKLAGYSFADRRKTDNFGSVKGERFVWYCDNATARLWSDGDLVTVSWSAINTPVLAVNDGEISAKHIFAHDLTVTGGRVVVRGAMAGFSFSDRSLTSADARDGDEKGERYVWYCDHGAARLWSGGDLLSIKWKTALCGRGNTGANAVATLKLAEGGELEADRVTAGSLTLGSLGDVAALLGKLTARIAVLEGEVAALKSSQ